MTYAGFVLLLALAQRPPAPVPNPKPDAASLVRTVDQNARETREHLSRILNQYPPSLPEVLRLDPSLLSNQDYLGMYPALASFLTEHPEVAHNPSFFVGDPRLPDDPRRETIRMWRESLKAMAGFGAALIVIGLLSWVVRTFIDYRRWVRMSNIQTDVHTKLLDRFSSHEDLLAYIQTPAGKRFLESGPLPVEGPSSISAPVGRILWSVQAGLVLVFGGIGAQLVSTRITEEVSQPLFVIGVLGMALGTGFVISAIVSFLLSRRLGLFEQRQPNPDA